MVLIGDSKCGKTALIHRFANDNFLQIYTPTGFERYTVDRDVGNLRTQFTIWDTSGVGAYDSVRHLCYQDARVFLLCFDVTSQMSLLNVLKKWHPEIRKHSEAPIVLCGCRSDLSVDSKFTKYTVSSEQALSVARQIGAVTYVETSSLDSTHTVSEAFEVAALASNGKLHKSHHMLTFVRHHAPHLKRHLLKTHRTCCIM